jgi:hypothetical protein
MLAVGARAFGIGISAAEATEDFYVTVTKTPDHFLALRTAPTTNAEIVAKLPEGAFLQADTARCETRQDLSICDEHIPTKWVHVNHVDGHNELRGWVSSRYVREFECGM